MIGPLPRRVTRTLICLLPAGARPRGTLPPSHAMCTDRQSSAHCRATTTTGNDRMSTSNFGRILWPNLPPEYHQLSRDAVGTGFQTDFCTAYADVSDMQWAEADAVVGTCPAQYIEKLRKCRIFVKYGVGYDDV